MIGVAGAGTMGSLIAALGCVAGEETLLWDADEGALGAGVDRACEELRGGAERGRWAPGREELLRAASGPDELASGEVVIEAIVERLDAKRSLFSTLREANPDVVLATNTSSIPVTAIGGTDPRVVGMHFFNPATRMKLVEVIAGAASDQPSLDRVRALGEAMGKRVIDATDGPGFLVNRCGRPFGLEALRLLQERVADVATIDRIVRLGGGYRMGPFELQDLVGIDVGFEVSKSFYELSFGEPRWRPSPLSARMTAAGWHGRKTGRGWYEYPPGRPEDPPAPEAGGGDGTVTIGNAFPVLDALAYSAAAAGWSVERSGGAAVQAAGSVYELGIDFHALAPLTLVELAGDTPGSFFTSCGLHTARIADSTGGVLGRIVAQLVNEACFAVGEGVGSPEDVDAGMELGLNHPRGPFAWLEANGPAHIAAILEALRAQHGDAYRLAPDLTRRLRASL
jgi:3-hydroxybutyryl-CoA dehydrogenase